MNHHDVELELLHLEYVFAHLSATHTVPPLSYWRGRLNALRKIPVVPQQRDRINRLEHLLGALEVSRPSSPDATPQEGPARVAIRARR
ncbi:MULTISPECIES: hypothetical protein [Paraburkholderia]|jgi:hypothetical protein|uniref:Uncharacterized protein n=1 Tax=Paraburkholderia phenazinium TaxID=60549 RepID=A0A1N6J5B8_9BURK|nr:hypothetical protein [Paraburkholderia phenazinium]SIO39487.1 hypothetical protein SAMN05444165_2803 [Paraburkholderia phenazinium]